MTTTNPASIKKFKRGATFRPTCRLPITGSLTNLTGVTIASSVVSTDGREYPCTVTIPSPTGRVFSLLIPAETTAKWSVGDASWDIKFKINGVVVVSETVILRIVKTATSTAL